MELSDRGKKVMGLAKQEARKLKHPYLGTQHLFIAILAEQTSVTADVLIEFGANLVIVRGHVEVLSPVSTKALGVAGLRKTPDLKKALEYAVQEAMKLGDKEVCPIHFLLGMLRMEKSQAVEILRDLGIDLGELRKAVIKAYRAKIVKKNQKAKAPS